MHINATYYVDSVSMPIVTGFIHIWTIPFKAVINRGETMRDRQSTHKG